MWNPKWWAIIHNCSLNPWIASRNDKQWALNVAAANLRCPYQQVSTVSSLQYQQDYLPVVLSLHIRTLSHGASWLQKTVGLLQLHSTLSRHQKCFTKYRIHSANEQFPGSDVVQNKMLMSLYFLVVIWKFLKRSLSFAV